MVGWVSIRLPDIPADHHAPFHVRPDDLLVEGRKIDAVAT